MLNPRQVFEPYLQRVVVIFLCCTFASFFFSSLSYGQIEKLDLKKSLGEQITTTRFGSQQSTALERPVDPEEYVLGPGDGLAFRVWGTIELQFPLTVEPDGVIAIPNLGEIPVDGKTVAQAESIAKEMAAKQYPGSEVSLSLTRIRNMKVSIGGIVSEPGIYSLSAVDRLSSLIITAGGFFESREFSSAEGKFDVKKVNPGESDAEKSSRMEVTPSKRRIQINSLDGTTINVDYLRYQRTGDIESNPVLRDGDRIYVPPVDADIGVLNIFGQVKIPGEYEFVTNDRLIDLVDLAGGFKANASLSDITIVRFKEDNLSYQELKFDFEKDQGRGPNLLPDDRVFVRKKTDYRNKYHVTVNGEVSYTGVYPIDKDTTTLTEIIEECGGFTRRANLKGAKVIRNDMSELDDPEFERLKKMNVAEMTDMEYEYFKTRSREEAPAVVVDFERLFEDNEQSLDVTLRDRDIIEIPTLSPTVKVAGQVNSPGLVRWTPGHTYEYYIEKAGGFSWNARKGKMRLIKAQTGKWLKPKKTTPIEIGDTIFVPEKQEIDYWELWKDILLVASQVATIIIVVQSVR